MKLHEIFAIGVFVNHFLRVAVREVRWADIESDQAEKLPIIDFTFFEILLLSARFLRIFSRPGFDHELQSLHNVLPVQLLRSWSFTQ